MPISQMRSGLTAGNSIFSQKPTINVSRSRFDLSRPNYFTADMGAIVPVDYLPVMPGDELDLSVQYRIDFKPMIVPSFTAYKVKIHFYYAKYSDLWSGWESFITKGRSGKLALAVPQIKLSQLSMLNAAVSFNDITDYFGVLGESDYFPLAPHSLASYLLGNCPYYDDLSEIPDAHPDHYLPFIYGSNASGLKYTGFRMMDCSALPFLMYQKIFRSNYLDPNLLSNGTVASEVWFPDDIDSTDWRFSYSANNLAGTYGQYFVPQSIQVPSSDIRANFVPIPHPVDDDSTGDNAVNLLQLRYCMYMDDMFTTALPFLQRGSQQTLDMEVADAVISGNASVSGSFTPEANSAGLILNSFRTENSGGVGLVNANTPVVTSIPIANNNQAISAFYATADSSNSYRFGLNPSAFTVAGSAFTVDGSQFTLQGAQVAFTAEKLRQLIAISVWQERNALTNGSYGQFIKVHFDRYPDNELAEPIYIGGTTSVFNTNSVLQTSSSVANSPQANPAGVSSTGNSDSIAKFRVPDWGAIMCLMMIVPDTTYVQTNDHWVFDKSPDDFYMPEYEKLSYQPILNKQIFYSGNEETDNDVFGYSNRYVYMKQRDGIARGLFQLPPDLSIRDHAYVQSRIFSETPKLSQQFVTVYPPNLDRSFLAYPGEPAFLVQFFSGVRAVRSMAYASQPNTFGF